MFLSRSEFVLLLYPQLRPVSSNHDGSSTDPSFIFVCINPKDFVLHFLSISSVLICKFQPDFLIVSAPSCGFFLCGSGLSCLHPSSVEFFNLKSLHSNQITCCSGTFQNGTTKPHLSCVIIAKTNLHLSQRSFPNCDFAGDASGCVTPNADAAHHSKD